MGSAFRVILPIKVSTDYLRNPNEVCTSQPLGSSKWGRRVTDGLVEARTPPTRLSDQSSPLIDNCAIVAVEKGAMLPRRGEMSLSSVGLR